MTFQKGGSSCAIMKMFSEESLQYSKKKGLRMRLFIILGAINMALAIALGAFGAHGLEGRVTEKMINRWETAAHYHIIHALALVVVGLLITRMSEQASLLQIAGWVLLVGIILFSGSLYTLVLTGVTKLGAITPIGGVSFLIGWILIAIAAWKASV